MSCKHIKHLKNEFAWDPACQDYNLNEDDEENGGNNENPEGLFRFDDSWDIPFARYLDEEEIREQEYELVTLRNPAGSEVYRALGTYWETGITNDPPTYVRVILDDTAEKLELSGKYQHVDSSGRAGGATCEINGPGEIVFGFVALGTYNGAPLYEIIGIKGLTIVSRRTDDPSKMLFEIWD
ncbi:MAG: hypothetical protein LBC87_12050 [Fibromonadaceae bacterium]|jgi:hypothetical protein|nr:hypothetical protein [Fibromonadaceae bacterium]